MSDPRDMPQWRIDAWKRASERDERQAAESRAIAAGRIYEDDDCCAEFDCCEDTHGP